MELELTKEMEKSIREDFTYHDPAEFHALGFEPCKKCVILILLAEIDRLREENLKLRVNP